MNRHSARDYKRARRGSHGTDGFRWRDFALGLALGLVIAAVVWFADHRAGTAVSGAAASGAIRSAHERAGRTPKDASPAAGASTSAPHGSAAHNATAHTTTAHASSATHSATDAPTPHAADLDSAAGVAATARTAGGTSVAGSKAGAVHPEPAASSAAAAGKFDFYQMLPRFEVIIPGREQGSRPPASAQINRPGTYFLQVGSYRDRSVAERVRAEVARLGIGATVQRVTVDNGVWHRVRVGPIHDLGQLNRLRRQLQTSNLDALVIRVDD